MPRLAILLAFSACLCAQDPFTVHLDTLDDPDPDLRLEAYESLAGWIDAASRAELEALQAALARRHERDASMEALYRYALLTERVDGLLAHSEGFRWACAAEGWFDTGAFAGGEVVFSREAGLPQARVIVYGSGVPVISDTTTRIEVRGDTLAVSGRRFVVDKEAGVLLDLDACGRRLIPEMSLGAPLLEDLGRAALIRKLEDESPLIRREAVYALARERRAGLEGFPEHAALFADPDPAVRAQAAWAAGETRAHEAVPGLLGLLEDESAAVRREATRALGWGALGGEDAIPAVRDRLDDLDPGVRKAAERALEILER